MTRWLHTTRLWPLMLLLAVSGCRSVKDVQVRTEYRTLYQRDSVFIDCTDTLYVVERGDTVTIREKQTVREYYYTVFRDTLRQSDTVRLERVVQLAGETQKPVKRWRWFLFGALSAIFIIFAVRIIIKIYLHK